MGNTPLQRKLVVGNTPSSSPAIFKRFLMDVKDYYESHYQEQDKEKYMGSYMEATLSLMAESDGHNIDWNKYDNYKPVPTNIGLAGVSGIITGKDGRARPLLRTLRSATSDGSGVGIPSRRR